MNLKIQYPLFIPVQQLICVSVLFKLSFSEALGIQNWFRSHPDCLTLGRREGVGNVREGGDGHLPIMLPVAALPEHIQLLHQALPLHSYSLGHVYSSSENQTVIQDIANYF